MHLKTLCGRLSSRFLHAGYKRKLDASFEEAKKVLYDRHDDVLYSSYLETQLARHGENMLPHALNPGQDDVKRHYPTTSWMDDYEFYKGPDGEVGLENRSIPPSTVPCSGCGAHLHCVKSSLPGYIPSQIFIGRTRVELQTIICQRCYFLKHYNIALDVEVTPETYLATISSIKDKFALAIVIVDLVDFPCSIWPGLADILGPKRPVFIVGNKVDLVPRDSNNYLERVKESLHQQAMLSGFNALNVKCVSLISAKTGYGIEELITQLHKVWGYKGDVYLVGCTNVGKSTLFNILLNSDYCRPEASKLVRKATTCPWPGTTLQMLKFPIYRPSDIRVYQRFQRLFSERAILAAEEKLRRDQAKKTGSIRAATLIGKVRKTFDNCEESNDAFAMSSGTIPITTLNEKSDIYKSARWCYDTPGVLHPSQITNSLTAEELLLIQAKKMIVPRAVRLPINCSLFIAGLTRLDFVSRENTSQEWIKVIVFSASKMPLLIARTNDAVAVYDKYMGTPFLGVPMAKRPMPWLGLQPHNELVTVVGTKEKLTSDITLPSIGWIALEIPDKEKCAFLPWTPEGRGIYARTPPLIPFANNLVGKHIRNSLAYNLSKPFVFKKQVQ